MSRCKTINNKTYQYTSESKTLNIFTYDYPVGKDFHMVQHSTIFVYLITKLTDFNKNTVLKNYKSAYT